MKKKVIILAMASAMCSAALLAGCGEETATSTPSAPASSSASSAAPAESSSVVETLYSSQTSSTPLSSFSSAPVSSSSISKTPKLSESEFKAKCQTMDYKSLARNPDKYVGEYAKFYGQVLQVMEEKTNQGTLVSLRVSTKASDYGNYHDDIMFVSYFMKDGDGRILEEDMINIYGTMMPLYTYQTVLGDELSLPWVHAEYLDLKE